MHPRCFHPWRRRAGGGKRKTRAGSSWAARARSVRSTPIGDYGFLSDGEVSALLSPNGAVEWMCVPRFDSAERLRAHPGPERRAPSASRPRTWSSRPRCATCPGPWSSRRAGAPRPAGSSCATPWSIGPWHHEDDRSKTYRRTPSDYEAEHMLVRTIRCVSGRGADDDGLRARLRLRQDPRRVGVQRRRLLLGHGERRGRGGHRHPDQRHEARLRGRAGQHPDAAQAGRHAVRLPVLGRGRAARGPTRRRTTSRSGPRTTGSTGWPAAGSRTTRGAATCSGPR